MGRAIRGVITAFFLAVIVVLAVYTFRPVDPVPASAPETEFSSARAMQHLGVIATEPHPIGSPAHRQVREYLLQQLSNLGLQPTVHTTAVTRYRSVRFARFATVHNVIARLPGEDNTKAILLLSHYDSVPNAHGATDDGSGVVTMLETARALTKGKPLRNDVIFLFTDGEEIGLMGAKAFVEQHPWIQEVGLVLNFEGSGSGGPVMMFETSDENGWLIDQFADAAPHPVANSLSYEIYKRMPNDTDLTMFRRAGIPGLNFAYIDNRYDYHTQSDNIDHIEEGSIQHHGSYAISLTKHFGNLSLNEVRAENAVYFNLFGFGFVHYPQSWVLPLALLAILIYALVLGLGFRARQLHFSGLAKGLGGVVAALAIIPLTVKWLFDFLSRFYENANWWLLYYNHKILLLGFVFLSVSAFAILFRWFRKGMKRRDAVALGITLLVLQLLGQNVDWRFILLAIVVPMIFYFSFRTESDTWSLTMGSLFGWLALASVVSVTVPGGSYLFIWPLLASLVPLIVIFTSKSPRTHSVKNVILLCLFAIPGVFWFSQVAYTVFIAMGINMSWLPIGFATLLLGLLMPHFYLMTSGRPRWMPGLTASLGFVFILWLVLYAEFDERYRMPNTVFYAYDADNDTSFWATTDPRVDSWTSRYLTDNIVKTDLNEILPTTSATMLKASAPKADVVPPKIELLHQDGEGARRKVALLLTSPRGAPMMNIFFGPHIQIHRAIVNGIEPELGSQTISGSDTGWWRWRYYGLPKEGIEIILDVSAAEKLQVKLLDISYGFPNLVDFTPEARPSNMMPAPYTLSDMTLAYKTYELPQSQGYTTK